MVWSDPEILRYFFALFLPYFCLVFVLWEMESGKTKNISENF